MPKAQQTKGLAVVLYYIVDGFDCLSNGAKIYVLMFWIFREKVCLTEAHYFIKSGKLTCICLFQSPKFGKIVFFQTSFSN